MRLTVDTPPGCRTEADSAYHVGLARRAERNLRGANGITVLPTTNALTNRRGSHSTIAASNLKNTIGLASLGLMTNQVWYDDPRRLTFLLARYKFVAKMLSGCHNAGEVGCGDAFGTRIVLQEVPTSPFMTSIRSSSRYSRAPGRALAAESRSARYRSKSRCRASTTRCSAWMCSSISRPAKNMLLSNLCESLTEDGMLMIGTPSLGSQTYASPLSKAGHINCKSGKRTEGASGKIFRACIHIFHEQMRSFTLVLLAMAHYFFALCAQPKWEASERPICGRRAT